MNRLLLLGALLICIYSCNNSTPQSKESYKLFNLEKRGWKSKTKIQVHDDIQYRVTEVPLQYYLLKELGNQDLKIIDSLYELNKEERVIEVEIEQLSKDDVFKSKYTDKDYESTVKYAAFNIQEDFKVVLQSGDTINSAGVLLERNFKVAPFKRLIVHFGGIPPEEDIQLIYNDQLWKNGQMKFDFKETPIELQL